MCTSVKNPLMHGSNRSHLARCLVLCTAFILAGCGGSSSDNNPGNGAANLAPGQDDEPVPENTRFNTATNFSVTREPGPRLPEPEEILELTDVEFNRGLPAAVLQTPDGLDTSINQPPFFENLQNLEVLAGDTIEVVYQPQDPDGELPGMFPEKLPQGAQFVDNFDGSKTFTWQPLQMDVGINRFTVTAVDAADQRYRSSQSILIKVVLPEDSSTIPNVAPMLDTILAHTVRVNDPVVFELKGIDLNGTVPTIEIPDLPAMASVEQDPRFNEIYVLKVVPTTVGEFTIDVLVRDSVDPGLFVTEQVSFNVLAPSAFDRPGTALRALAQNRDIDIGFAALQSFYHRPDGALYADTAAREFSIVTPENSMKMDHINPQPGRYQFAATDNLVSFARQYGMRIHGHPLIWYRQLPAWVEATQPQDREGLMRDYITNIMSRYQSDITLWDVVNEPLSDNGGFRDSVWFEAMGERYIDLALQQARRVDPSATLLINEFDIAFAGPKFDALLQLVDNLQARQIPLDGIGFQLHLFADFDQFDELASHFAAIAARGLDIYITELDVSLSANTTLSTQADVYQQIATICLQQSRCRALQMWGLTDQYSFRSNFDPLPFDRAYQAKPAYRALQQALENSR